MKTEFTFFILIPILAIGQIDESTNSKSERQIEWEGRLVGEDQVEGIQIDDLSMIMKEPLDLNSSNYEDLKALTLLSYEQIDNLLKHRLKYGLIHDIEELQMIEGFDSSTVHAISKYVRIKTQSSWKSNNSIDRKHKTTLLFRTSRILEKSKAYKVSNLQNGPHYQGSPNSVYLGFRHRYLDKISVGILGEKDAGEEFFKGGQQNGFDFYSAHLSLKVNQFVRQVIIGDYQVHFGQGLCFSSSAIGGKSSDVLLVEKNLTSIRGNFSVNESTYLRGIASELDLGALRLTTFYSIRKHDANLSSNKDDNVTSIYTSGLHRTDNERAKRSNISSQIMGINLLIKAAHFHPGFTFVRQELNKVYSVKPQLYTLNTASSRIHFNSAFHCNFDLRNVHFFGEIAHAASYGNAMISGVILNVDPRIHLNISYRNYGRNYTTSYSSAFSENRKTSNEKGLFTSMVFRLNRVFTWSVYVDFFRFPWLRYQVNSPSWGMARFTEVNFRFSKKMQLSLSLKLKEKQKNQSEEDRVIESISIESKIQMRTQLTYQIHENLRLRSRIEFVRIHSDMGVEKGFLSFHELKFKRKKTPIAFLLRLSFFDTDSYSARIYAYEQDVPGTYSIPSHYGLGSRILFLTSYKVYRNLTIYLKFSQSIYENQEFIGSSWDRINGPVKSEVKFMCKIDL